jgi:hypothetical protein
MTVSQSCRELQLLEANLQCYSHVPVKPILRLNFDHQVTNSPKHYTLFGYPCTSVQQN